GHVTGVQTCALPIYQRGIAATRDALGDLYLIQGQYKIALDHYRSAYEAFVAASSSDQKTEAAANTVASRAGATASAATETAASRSEERRVGKEWRCR